MSERMYTITKEQAVRFWEKTRSDALEYLETLPIIQESFVPSHYVTACPICHKFLCEEHVPQQPKNSAILEAVKAIEEIKEIIGPVLIGGSDADRIKDICKKALAAISGDIKP